MDKTTTITLKGDKSVKKLIETLQKLDENWKATYWIDIETVKEKNRG